MNLFWTDEVHTPMNDTCSCDVADKFKMPKFSTGHNSGKIRWIFLKFNQVLLIIPYQLTKFQAHSSRFHSYFICWQILKKPYFSGVMALWKFGQFFLKVWSGNLLIIPYQLTKFQAPSSNTFRDILLTRFHSYFFKGARKKNTGQLFFHEESIYEISKP